MFTSASHSTFISVRFTHKFKISKSAKHYLKKFVRFRLAASQLKVSALISNFSLRVVFSLIEGECPNMIFILIKCLQRQRHLWSSTDTSVFQKHLRSQQHIIKDRHTCESKCCNAEVKSHQQHFCSRQCQSCYQIFSCSKRKHEQNMMILNINSLFSC